MQTDRNPLEWWGSGLLDVSRGVIAVSVLLAAVQIIWTVIQGGGTALVLTVVGLWLVSLAVGVAALVPALVGLGLKKRGRRRRRRTKLDEVSPSPSPSCSQRQASAASSCSSRIYGFGGDAPTWAKNLACLDEQEAPVERSPP